MDAFASLSREELIPLVQQQAELNLFLQQEILTLRAEIHRLKGLILSLKFGKEDDGLNEILRPNRGAYESPARGS